MAFLQAQAEVKSHCSDVNAWQWQVRISDDQGNQVHEFSALAFHGDDVLLPALKDLLHAHGFRMVGYWKPSPSGYTAIVLTECSYQPPSWAEPQRPAEIVSVDEEYYEGIPLRHRAQLYSGEWHDESDDAGSIVYVELCQVDRFKDGQIIRGRPRVEVQADTYGLTAEQLGRIVQALHAVQTLIPERTAV